MDLNLPYQASTIVSEAASVLPQGDISTLLLGAILVIAALVVIFVLKRIMENAIIGILGFLFLKYFLGVNVPFLPGIIISLLFGLGGLGVLLILHFFGIL